MSKISTLPSSETGLPFLEPGTEEPSNSSGTLSRSELERRLKAKGEAIAGRFEKIESKIPTKLPSLLSMVKIGTKSKVGIAVGAGLLIGVLIFGRKSSSRPIKYDDGLNKLSDQLASRVAELLRKGSNSKEAIRKAFEEQPPLMNVSYETESVLSTALKQVMQAGVTMVGTEIADYLRNRIKEKPSS